jgi:hypothetical protein
MADNLRTLGRDEAKLVYRNDRMLIGWRITRTLQTEEATSKTLRTEAWVGEVSREEDADDDDDDSAHLTTTNLLRVYTTSDGSDKLFHGVMGIDEAHPAILHPHTDMTAFLEMGKTQRLDMVERELNSLKTGRRVFCEFEGGELKDFFGRNVDDVDDSETDDDGSEDHEPENDDTDDEIEEAGSEEGEVQEWAEKKKAEKREKRKRALASCNSPRSDGGGGKRRCSEPEVSVRERKAYGNHDEDDEDMTPMKKEEPADSSSRSMSRETVAHVSANDENNPTQTMSSSLDRMSLEPGAVKDEKNAGQEQPMSPMQLATQLGADVNQQAWEWAAPASRRGINLTNFTRPLATADSVNGKLEMCGKIFVGMREFRAKFTRDRKNCHEALNAVIFKLLPNQIIKAHKHMTEEYEKAERLVADTVRLLEERAQALADKDIWVWWPSEP